MRNIISIFILLILASCTDDRFAGGIVIGDPINGDNKYLIDQVDFPIGNIVSASKLESTLTDNLKFKELITTEFNSITAENDMKMNNMYLGPNDYDWSDGDAIVAYAKENGLRVHGHTLIWHPEYAIPNWLESFSGTDEEFHALIENYIKATVSHFAEVKDSEGNSIVASWDVVNEAFDGGNLRSSLFRTRMGDDYVKKCFQWAREADPNVKLFYNDYSIFGNGVKRNAIISMVNDFKANNVPIDGIGMQTHITHNWPSASDLTASIQEVANLGLLVHLSELDIQVNYGNDITTLTTERANSQSDQFQLVANYYVNYVPKAQQHGITLWGMRDNDSWLYEGGTEWPLLFDISFDPKPAYDGFKNGLKN